MKVLLVQPPKAPKTIGGEDIQIFEPLALEYLAAGIIENHEVKILDMRFNKHLEEVINEFKPEIIGITSYTVNVNTVKDIFRKIKLINSEILTVVGGHHATVVPEDFFIPEIDLIVIGEGVFTFREIVSRFEKNDGFGGLSGIAYIKDSNKIIIPPENFSDMDSLPFPARHLTKEYRKNYYSEWMKPLASLRTSKGCPFRCKFCALWKLTGGKYLKRSPESIVKELSQIEEKYVFFADDESLIDAKRMKILAELIKESGINKRFFLYGRSDTIAKNPDLIKIWKEVGLERVFVGLEFFRDSDLKYINKQSSVENNIETVKILQSNNIDIFASFIVRPDFIAKDFVEYKDFCRKLNLDFAGFSVLTPLPGTELYEEVKDKLITENYDLFDFFHPVLPTTLSLKEYFEKVLFLYGKSKSFSKSMSFMMKYQLNEIPALIGQYTSLYRHIKNAYKDY